MLFAILFVSPNRWDEESIGDEVPDQDWDKRKTLCDGTKIVLSVDEGEGLDEHEDEGIAEAGKEGERKNDGFSEEHLEGPDPGDDDLLEGETPLEGRDFVGPVEVRVRSILASLLGDPVHHDSGSGLRNED